MHQEYEKIKKFLDVYYVLCCIISVVVVKAGKEFKKIIYLNRKPILLKAVLSESDQEFIVSFIRHKYLCAGTGEPWGYKGHKTDWQPALVKLLV